MDDFGTTVPSSRLTRQTAAGLIGRNCETVAIWCTCGMRASLRRQRFQAWNVAVGTPNHPAYTYHAGRGLSSGRAMFKFGHLISPRCEASLFHVLPPQPTLLPRRRQLPLLT